jgi:hypothetical protein
MVRPAGPRISSMIWETRSFGIDLLSRRSVESKVPIREPVDEIWLAKSTQSLSITAELTVPSVDIEEESSLISSSPIIENRRAVCSSPSASISAAARSMPLMVRISSRTFPAMISSLPGTSSCG